MKKERTGKTSKKRKKRNPILGLSSGEKKIRKDDLLIDNFVGLQKAMTNLSIKFSELSNNISRLLVVFENSARILSKTEKEVDRALSNKIDSIIEQNKTLAKGVVMMDNKLKQQKIMQMQAPKTMKFSNINMPQKIEHLNNPSNAPAMPEKPKQLPQI